jgi:ubiquitin-activating enzyme E1
MKPVGLVLLSLVAAVSSSSFGRPSWFPRLRIPRGNKSLAGGNVLPPSLDTLPATLVRGGDTDEERYSRQVYTLGARAHGLVRSSTIYIDGPATSGLVYECAKNLALSGVGSIVILTHTDEKERKYHNSELDDLGNAYQRAARAEIGHEVTEDDETLLMEYLKRLNPSVAVSIASRSELTSTEQRGVLLCVDRPHSTQVTLNNKCRHEGLAFVAVETAGVYGRTFCDFGPSFEVVDADGETPLVVPLDRIEPIEGNLVQVHCIEGEKHDVSKGECIEFQLSSGETLSLDCIVVQVQSPRRITVRCNLEDTSLEEMIKQVSEQATSFSRVKIPETVNFVSLQEASELAKHDDSIFTPCDLEKSFDPVRRGALVSCFHAVEEFVTEHKGLPSKTDVVAFGRLTRKQLPQPIADAPLTESVCESFCKCCAGKLAPIQAILGAISAQEVLKATSGLYSPIRQFLLYDCDELLTGIDDNAECGTTGLSYILGQTFCQALANKRLFVVGAGAIGCELLKNLSAMGVGTGSKGLIAVTDMDTIEKSNLSRQLLFRDTDIGKFKSTAAHEAILRFNPNVRAEVHTSRVGQDEHGPFDDEFWSKRVDTVLNALDNMEARLYMDGQCVAHQKSLIDAGTLGSKGNVQVVVPHQSESYGSSVDPPEPAIPVCTLKNFPYAIAHTIQWGRDLFDGCFQRRPKQANDYAESFLTLGVDEFADRLVKDLGEKQAYEVVDELGQDWATPTRASTGNNDSIRETCIQWAVAYANNLFHDSIEDLLRQHPVYSVDEDGELFWSGTRRAPKVLEYIDSDAVDAQQSTINNNLVDFVRYAARLRIEMVVPNGLSPGESNVSIEEAIDALLNSRGKESTSSGGDNEEISATNESEEIKDCLQAVVPDKILALQVAEFEKDDEANGHVAFVTAASNLRALCYGIAPVDAMETRRVAGRIVPAMISTTAFVSALSCVELLKLVQGAPLERHRNGFINLALPFFAYTSPISAERISGLQGTSYTLWDRITVKEGQKSAGKGGITLKSFLRRVAKKAGADPNSISVATVSYGPYMIYASFLHEDDDEMLSTSILELLREAILTSDDDEFAGREEDSRVPVEHQLACLESRGFVDFTVVVEDIETGEESELPPVRLVKRIV